MVPLTPTLIFFRSIERNSWQCFYGRDWPRRRSQEGVRNQAKKEQIQITCLLESQRYKEKERERRDFSSADSFQKILQCTRPKPKAKSFTSAPHLGGKYSLWSSLLLWSGQSAVNKSEMEQPWNELTLTWDTSVIHSSYNCSSVTVVQNYIFYVGNT